MTTWGLEHTGLPKDPIALVVPKLVSLSSVIFIQIPRLAGNEYKLIVRIYCHFCQMLVWNVFHCPELRFLDIIALYNTFVSNHVQKLIFWAYSN